MKAVKLKDVPAGAVTVELTEREALEALCAYVGRKRGDSFRATAEMKVITKPGQPMRIILSYWRPS